MERVRILKGRIGAILTVVEKAVSLVGNGRHADDAERSDDLARVVDAVCGGVAVRKGIVEEGEGVDCHDTGLLSACRARSIDRVQCAVYPRNSQKPSVR